MSKSFRRFVESATTDRIRQTLLAKDPMDSRKGSKREWEEQAFKVSGRGGDRKSGLTVEEKKQKQQHIQAEKARAVKRKTDAMEVARESAARIMTAKANEKATKDLKKANDIAAKDAKRASDKADKIAAKDMKKASEKAAKEAAQEAATRAFIEAKEAAKAEVAAKIIEEAAEKRAAKKAAKKAVTASNRAAAAILARDYPLEPHVVESFKEAKRKARDMDIIIKRGKWIPRAYPYFHLGSRYERGDGVVPNFKKALVCFQKALKLGDNFAESHVQNCRYRLKLAESKHDRR